MAVVRPRPPRLLVPLLPVLLSCPAAAADCTVGIGAGAAPDYDGSDDHRPVPAWLILADDLYHPDTYDYRL
jgi:outer membrane scaffolding protein for murein synthesis (MipA/OmpV family)